MKIKQKHYETKLIKMKEEMDKMPAEQRLSFMENNVEILVNQFREQLNEEMTNKINSDNNDKNPIQCECGSKLYYQDEKKTLYITHDQLYFFRSFYYCKKCKKSYFPLDTYLNIEKKEYSLNYAMLVSHFIALTSSFSDCRKALLYSKLAVCSQTLIQKIGNAVGKIGKDEENNLIEKSYRYAQMLGQNKHHNIFTVLLDGGKCKVWQNQEKLGDSQWKEVKLGGFCSYSHIINKKGERELIRKSTGYVGRVQEEAKYFGKRLYLEALTRGYNNSKIKVFLGDGMPYNWEIYNAHFSESIPILDWYHAVEHLAKIAKIIFGDNSETWQPWYKEVKDILYEGDWEWLLQKIDIHLNKLPNGETKKVLSKERNYFYNNRERINYAEYEKIGLPIGSGVIESGIKITVNKRLKGTEKHWRKDNANNILKLRIDELNDGMQNLCQLYSKAA